MKARDVAIVAAVLLVGGIAAADALRGAGGGEPERTALTTTEAGPPPPPERFPPLPVGGALAFADAEDCRLRIVDVVGGRERRLDAGTGCDVSAPPSGPLIAVGSGREGASGVEFRLLFLEGNLAREVGGGARFGPIVWSPRGRFAWCESATNGVEFDGEEARELAFCPRGYVGERLVRTRDREVLVEGRDALAAGGYVEQVAGGIDGSLALVLEGGRVERRGRDGRAVGVRLPSDSVAAALVFTRDTCAAAAVGLGTVSVVDLGCFRGRGQVTTVSTDNCTDRWESANSECASYPAPRVFPGSAAAWSPNGEWLAVAGPSGIAFHRLVGGYRIVRWNVGATDLAWLELPRGGPATQ